MSFCRICILRRLRRPQQINPGQEQHHTPHPSSDIRTELKDSRKFSLSSLTTILPQVLLRMYWDYHWQSLSILAVSGSMALQPMVLTLLLYTISLWLAMNTCFYQNFPTVSRFLHVIPLLAMSCMVGVELVSRARFPVLASVAILLGVLPLATIVIHHGGRCADTSAA